MLRKQRNEQKKAETLAKRQRSEAEANFSRQREDASQKQSEARKEHDRKMSTDPEYAAKYQREQKEAMEFSQAFAKGLIWGFLNGGSGGVAGESQEDFDLRAANQRRLTDQYHMERAEREEAYRRWDR
ncbi:hypothetical protein [Roseiconus lacunae]|uniref:hypothetical protein n=1 Tax=Roseiconus lacunae TaxID=2605694 RepID=UPI001E36EE10|nr:hypothetical protein [Roseiconus lacunae]MCD0462392.1 hypothetical protein [Roseiconus lacunae]